MTASILCPNAPCGPSAACARRLPIISACTTQWIQEWLSCAVDSRMTIMSRYNALGYCLATLHMPGFVPTHRSLRRKVKKNINEDVSCAELHNQHVFKMIARQQTILPSKVHAQCLSSELCCAAVLSRANEPSLRTQLCMHCTSVHGTWVCMGRGYAWVVGMHGSRTLHSTMAHTREWRGCDP